MTFERPLTFLVGDNGSGKSTLVEAIAGADIIELGEHGFRRTCWEKLGLVGHWRRYLDNPEFYLHYLLDDDGETGQQPNNAADRARRRRR